MESLGKRIADRRKQLNLSQEEVAFRIGSTQNQISRYERGLNEPTAKVIVRFAEALETTPNELLGIQTPPPPEPDPQFNELEMDVINMLRSVDPKERLKYVLILRTLTSS